MEHYRQSVAAAEQRQREQLPPPPESVITSATVETAVDANGQSVATVSSGAVVEKAPDFPSGAPTGPHHTESGRLIGVKCSYPTVMTLTLDRPGKPLALYTNNYFNVMFTIAGPAPSEELLPCTGIEGMKARVEYGEVADKRVAGQILSVELSK